MTPGTYSVTATATDPAGNVGTDATTNERHLNTYYVNDTGPAMPGPAVGNDSNDGVAGHAQGHGAGNPLGNLEPGDVVRIDTGTYTLSSDIVLGFRMVLPEAVTFEHRLRSNNRSQ